MSGPPVYTEALAAAILERLAGGESLRVICQTPGYPIEKTVRRWAVDDRDGFSARYLEAREHAAEHWDTEAERVLREAPADRDEMTRARELASHFRWRASKLAPRVYGDRQQVDVVGGNTVIVVNTGVSRVPGQTGVVIEAEAGDAG